jgi:hypothetical protein
MTALRFYDRWLDRTVTPIRKLPDDHMGRDRGFQWSSLMESAGVQKRIFHRRIWLNKECIAYAPRMRLLARREAKRRFWPSCC